MMGGAPSCSASQTNSMCFWRKRSCVRRRYSEFVWLRHKLQENALLMDLPKLPPGTPFFSSRNSSHVAERMKGLQQFLEAVLQRTLFLSDSRLHLFLQSELSVGRMEACSQGLTRYTIAQAILSSAHNVSHPPYGPETRDDDDDNSSSNSDCDSDCESTNSSGLGQSVEPTTPPEEGTCHSDSSAHDCSGRSL